MLALQTPIMFQAHSQPEPSRPPYYHGRTHSNSNYTPHTLPPPPAPTARPELPRPMEPSSMSSEHRSRESYHYPSHAPSVDSRQPGPSLPGLKDLLSGPHKSPVPPPFNAPWNQPSGPAPSPSHANQGAPPAASLAENSYWPRNGGWHPPMALYPPPEPQGHPHPHPERRLELPYVDQGPAPRVPNHGSPMSPYTAYPDQHHAEYNERLRQGSTSIHQPNGAPSPYGSSTDEAHYALHGGPYDRSAPPAIPVNGTDVQRKYLGVQDIPGEGRVHLYEGGFKLPLQIDGEQVNPAWGLTKANKPRKRLALACLDCREKKIKCEPGLNSCLQCEKAKRPCRKAPTHTPHEQAPPSAWSNHATSPTHHGPPMSAHGASSEPDVDGFSKRRARDEPSPSRASHKKQRSTSPLTQSRFPSDATHGHRQSGSSPRSRRELGPDEDPFAVEPDGTIHLLELYLAHINDTRYAIFPRNTIVHWLTAHPEKNENERTVLYAMLATGSIFVSDGSWDGFGHHCAEIARSAVQIASRDSSNIFHVVTKLVLGTYYHAKGDTGTAWDFAGAAMRMAVTPTLKLNVEPPDSHEGTPRQERRLEFALTKDQFSEFRRRVFWTCFLMDRLNGNAQQCTINVLDVFVRLPCADEDYNDGRRSDAPMLSNGIIDPSTNVLLPSSRVSPMAWLVVISSIWGDVLEFVTRARHRAPSSYREAYETFYNKTHSDLDTWLSRLPPYLSFGSTNMERAVHDGFGDIYIVLHAMYHFTLMKLNRCVRHRLVHDAIARNIRGAHYHAHAALAIMVMLRGTNREMAAVWNPHSPRHFLLSTPFCGGMIMAAVDIVGAGGLDSTLAATREGISAGLDILRELSRYWGTARTQLRRTEVRHLQIENMVKNPVRAKSGCWIGREWGMYEPMEKDFDADDDCIWGMSEKEGKPNEVYFDALRDERLQQAICTQLYSQHPV